MASFSEHHLVPETVSFRGRFSKPGGARRMAGGAPTQKADLGPALLLSLFPNNVRGLGRLRTKKQPKNTER
jgi:hypothetical protein